jgi:hypothetical protein
LEGLSLEDFDIQSVKPKKFAESAEKLRKQFDRDLLNSKTSKEAVQIHYDPIVFSDKASISRTLRTKATVDQDRDPLSQTWRHCTKHRLVTSKVTGYMTGRGDFTRPSFEIIITTACAPNGKNGKEDRKKYFSAKDKDLSEYKKIMLLTYKRILHAQITNGAEVLIIPPIGLGVYLDKVPPGQKEKAIEMNYHALREAIESIGPGSPLKEIICVAPNSGNENKHLRKAHDVFSNCRPPIPTTFAPADALETAQKLTEKGYQVGIVNAGSDRTIGGGYAKINPEKLLPMEETLSQATDLVYIQAQDKGNPNYQYIPLPNGLCYSGPSSSAKSANNQPPEYKENQEDFNPKELETDIKQWLSNTTLRIIITQEKGSFQFSFRMPEEAKLFANRLLSDAKIGSRKNPGQAKSVQQGKDPCSSLVFLTPEDKMQLTKWLTELNKSRVNPNYNSKTTEQLRKEEYLEFQNKYKKALAKDKSVCFFGFFRRSNMDFTIYKNMDHVENYIKLKPTSRSARVYKEMHQRKFN